MNMPALLSPRRRSRLFQPSPKDRGQAPMVEPLEARIAPATFTNATAITLNDDTAAAGSTAASVYPSTIAVSGLTGSITDVNVTLHGVTAPRAGDYDILLVGPGGQSFVIVSDAGGNASAISNVTVTFDDQSANLFGDSSSLTGWGTGTSNSRPVNQTSTADTFPAPAPAGPYSHPEPGGTATFATIFNGLSGASMNGNWTLYIVDDALGGGNGTIAGGWSLDITSSAAAAPTTTTLTTNNPQSFTQSPDNSVTLTATVTSSSTVNQGTVNFIDTLTGVTLASNVAVVSGVATHTLTFGSEGVRTVQAVYNGTPSFATSNGTVSQEVNNQTTVLGGGQFANDFSGLTINDAPSLGSFGTATPYASKIFVSGQSGTITGLTVTLTNINEARPDDLDLLLVGPGGQTIVLMSDSGGTNALTNTTISFADSGATTLSDEGTITTGTYKPSNAGAGADTFPAPAPAASAATTLAGAFNGLSPNGEWKLFVVDDSLGGAGGSFAGGWKLAFTTAVAAATTTTLTTNNPQSFTQGGTDTQVTLTANVTSGSTVNEGTVNFVDLLTGATLASNVPVSGGVATLPNFVFTTEGTRNVQAIYNGTANFGTSSDTEVQEVNNPTVVTGTTFANSLSGFTVNDSPGVGQTGTGLPYPSKIFVTGIGTVGGLTVTLTNFSASRPDDLDFMLVGPTGQSIMLMSDNGGVDPTGPITLTFSDTGATTLPDDTTIAAGTYKPSNVSAGDTFPSPAPAPSAATTLAAFNGTSASGEWQLFVVDDSVGGGASSVTGGWSISITPLGTLSAAISGGNLTVTDIAGNANTLSVVQSGSNLVITDATEQFDLIPVGGMLSNGNRTLSIPLSSVTGTITLNTAGATDAVTLDLSGGDFINVGGVFFNGGESAGDNDKLRIAGYSLITADGVADVTVNHTGVEAGNVVLAGLGTVSFTQIEPLSLAGSAADLVINLPAGPNTATVLSDDGGAGDPDGNTANTSAIDDATFEYTQFLNPTNSLTINRGSATDSVTVQDLVTSGFNAGLSIGTSAAPFGTATLSGALTLGAGKSLSVAATTLNVGASGAATVSGGGAISVAANDVAINATGSLAAGTGTVTFVPLTAARPINLGTEVGGSLSFTDIELDRVTAGTIQIGDASSGTITISNAISRTAATNLSLTTGGNIVFGATGSLNVGAATATLAAAAGNIQGDAAALTNVTATTLSATASSGIGATNALESAVSTLTFSNTTNGVQITNTLAGGLTASGTNAGTGVVNITETSGNLTVGAADIVTNSGAVSLTASGLNRSLISAAGSNVQTTGGATAGAAVTWTADNISLGGNITAGTGLVTLTAATNATAIQVGAGAADAAGTLGLTDVELNLISTSGGLFIGSTANTGGITVVGATNLTTASVGGTVTLRSNSGNLAVNAALTTPAAATLQTTSGNISFGATGAITATGTATLSAVGGNINGNAAALTNVTATTLSATASSGIGATNALESAVSILTFSNTTNGVQVTNTLAGGLTASGTNAGTGVVNITETSGNLTVGAADIVTNSGAVSLTASGLNRSLISAAGSNVQTTGGATAGAAVTWTADNISLGGNITAGTGLVTLTAATNATAIQVGAGAADAAGTLGLTDVELNLISTSGGLFLGSTANTGGITVVGATNLTTASVGGTVTLRSNSGSLAVNAALTTPAAATLQTTSGNISFGATGAITATGTATLSAVGGNINGNAAALTNVTATTLSATATSGIGATNALESAVSTLTFANTTNGVQVTNTLAGGLTASGTNAGTGAVSITETSGNLTVGAADIVTNSGAVSLTASGLNRSLISAAGSDVQTTGGATAGAAVTWTADNMSLGGAITAGTGLVTLKQATNSTTINLGSVGGPTNGTLELSDAELDQITAPTINIGDANSGAITISAVISPASYQTLSIQKAASFSATGGFASDVTSATIYEKMQVAGAVAIDPAASLTVTAIGGFVPTASDTFTVIENTSASTTTGNFTGKPEGTLVPVGGVNKRLSYVGGTGSNDVVLGLDIQVGVTIGATPVAENSTTGLIYTFTRTGSTTSALPISFGKSGTTVAADYEATSTATVFDFANGTLTIPVGSSSVTVTLVPVNDQLVEGTEDATLTVNSTVNYGVSGSPATGAISDNDTATVALSAPGTTAAEGGGTAAALLTLTLTTNGTGPAQLANAVTVNLTDADGGTATGGGTDYTFTAPTPVTFAANSVTGATQTASFATIMNDQFVEGTETVNLSAAIGTGPATISGSTTLATNINDNDTATVALSAPGTTAAEGGGTAAALLTLTLTTNGTGAAQLANAVTVNLTDAGGGTATGGGTDYTFTAPTPVTFAANSTSGATQTANFATIVNDQFVEGTETVNLSAAIGTGPATISGSTTLATNINDNDTATVALSAPGTTAAEGGGTAAALLTLTLTTNGTGAAQLANAVTVNLTDAGGGSATGGGTDYTFTAPTPVTFAANSVTGATQTASFATIVNDQFVEGTETVNLSAAIGSGPATISGSTTLATNINDNDTATVALSAPGTTAAEGNGTAAALLTLTLTTNGTGAAQLANAVTVNLTDAGGGTATGGGTDYTFTAPTPVTFAANSVTGATQTASFATLVNDQFVEGTETVNLSAAIGSGPATISGSTTLATNITDNDTATISFAAATSGAPEATTPHLVGVTLVTTANGVIGGGTLARAISVTVSDLATGTATGTGTDYTFSPQVVTFGIGATDSTQTVSMAIVNDLVSEGDETVNLSLGSLADGTLTQASIIAPTTHTVTIADNDVDLVVTKTESIATVIAGSGTGNLIYTITVRNSGLLSATGIVLSEDLTLPAGVSLVSAVPSGGTFSATVAPDGTWTIPNLAPGASETLTVTLTAGASTANAAIIGDTVTITATDQVRVNTADDTATETTPVATQADLALTKGDTPDPVLPGANVTYTINFANNGPSDAQTLSIADTLPAGTTFVSASFPGGWSATTPAVGGTGTVTFTKAAAASAETGVFTIVVKTDVNTAGTTLTNTAGITSATTDLNNTNDSASTTTLVGGVDLVLTKNDSVTTTTTGSTLAYTLNYSNAGVIAATGVVLTETLPVGTTFNSAASTAGWTETAPGSGVFKLTVGTVNLGGSGSATFAVTVNATVAAGQASIINTATIADDAANGADSTPGDNTTTDTDVLNAAPDLRLVSKSDGTGLLVPGATSTYTINFANIGNQGATGVAIQDVLPTNTSFVAGENPGWSQVGNTLTYNVGALAAGATGSATLILHVADPLPPGVIQITNTATILDDDANGADPAANDSASDTNVFGVPITIVNGKTAKYVDVDGDLVTVRVSKGTLEQSDFVLVPSGVGAQLMLVNFSDDGAEFKNATLTVSATKKAGGNGMVNVGYVNATGVDLGAVRIFGDLGQIDAGDATLTTTGLQNLVVESLGTVPNTQLPGTVNPLHSQITGKLGSIVSRGNVAGVVDVTGGASGSIGRVNILGSLDGSAGGTEAGLIRTTGNVGPVGVKSNLTGGADFSGLISGGKIGQVTVKGEVGSTDVARPVLISALGNLTPVAQSQAVALSGLQVSGNVTNARILAGFNYVPGAPAALVPTNPDAAIGNIAVAGAWTASSVVAGVADSTADGFGRNDTLFAGDTRPNIVASIASITIKGSASGTAALGDYYGLTAQRLAKIKIGATTIALTAGANDIPLDTVNNDFRAVDFA